MRFNRLLGPTDSYGQAHGGTLAYGPSARKTPVVLVLVVALLAVALTASLIWMADPGPTEAQTLPTASIAADAAAQEGEDLTFTIRLSGPATEGITLQHTVSTESSDTVPAELPGYSATEGRYTGDIIVDPLHRSRPWRYVSIPQGHTEATFTIQTVEDNVVEAAETFTVTLSLLLQTDPVQLGDVTATGTITDDDHPPTHVALSLDKPAVAEKSGRQTVVVTATIQSCTSYASDQDVVLSLAPGAGAVRADYTAGPLSAVTIPAGKYTGEAEFAITPVDDGPGDSGETVIVSGALGSATVAPVVLTIIEAPSISIADATAGEGAALSFNVTLSQAATGAVTVNYAASVGPGDTASASDFAPAQGRLTYAPGETAKQITVDAVDDSEDEDDTAAETFTVSLSNPIGAVLQDHIAAGMITDNDDAPTSIALSLNPATIAETDQFLPVAVSATVQGATTFGEDKTVRVSTAAGTAISGTDYVATADRWIRPIIIPAGETSGETEVRIRAIDDGSGDSGETVIISGALPGVTVSNATLTISESALSASGATALEGDALRFTVTLTPAQTTATAVNYATSVEFGDTAESADFAAANGTLNFATGETQKTVSITTANDSDSDDETFSLILSSATNNVVIVTPQVAGTIIDDDGPLRFPHDIYTHVVYAGANVNYTVPAALNVASSAATYSATASPTNNYGLTFAPSSRTVSGTLNANAGAGTVIRYTVTAAASGRSSGSTTVAIMVISDQCSGVNTWHPTGITPSAGLVRDCNILLAARDTLRGSETLDWALSTDITQWGGINESYGLSNERVHELLLAGGGFYPTVSALNGQIPPLLGGLDALTRLTMYKLKLTGRIPPELGGLSGLERLELEEAGALTGGIPAELGSLTKLQELEIQRAPLGGTIPPELGRLSSIVTLRLWNLELTGAIPTELGSLASLRELSIGNQEKQVTTVAGPGDEIDYRNRLSGPIPASLGNLYRLTVLELNYNDLSGPIPAELGKLSRLVNLNLDGNRLTGPLPPELTRVGSAAFPYILNLRGNMLTSPAAVTVTPLNITEGADATLVKVKISVTDPATKFANSFFRNLPAASGLVDASHRGGVPAAISTGPQTEPPCNVFSLDPIRTVAGEQVQDEEHEMVFIITSTDDDGSTDDGRISFALEGTTLAGTRLTASPVSLFIRDNDIPSPGNPRVNVSASSLEISEADSAGTYYVTLEQRPTDPVTVSVSSSDTGSATVSPGSLTFNRGNWSRPQWVWVTGVDDDLDNERDRRTATISHWASGAGYDYVPVPSVSVTVRDDDSERPGGGSPPAEHSRVRVSASFLEIFEEGSRGSYYISLDSQPSGSVTITATSSDPSTASVRTPTLTFTTVNWNNRQTVSVDGVNDDVVNPGGQRTATISHSASGGGYDGESITSVVFAVRDDD